jgi:hypothetical protein
MTDRLDLRRPREERLQYGRALVVASVFVVACAGPARGQTSAPAPQGAPGQQTPPATSPPPLDPGQEVAGQQPEGNGIAVGPATLRIGGYLGLTAIYRSTNSGGGTGTRFASTPYEDDLQGNVSQARLTAESSRISIRVDAEFPEEENAPRFRALAGYFEMDFSGTAPGNVVVTSGSAGLRMRNAFAEVRYGDSFLLSVGQAFTLMTPIKARISMWPSDLELSQAVDTNYLAGVVWGRYPQLRLTWRASNAFDWAVSLENPEQQLGDSIVTLPACCAGDIAEQYNTGSDGLNVPNLMPDVVTRVALNPNARFHVDAGGVLRVFRHTVAPYTTSFKQLGGGGSVNLAVRPTGSTRLLAQGSLGSGMGRYLGGLVPDAAFHPDGSISPIRTAGWVTGLEQQISPRTSLAGYYSGVHVDSNYDTDNDGRIIGYGFPGAPNSNNRTIQQVTGTFVTRVVTTPTRGSAQLATQVSWLERTRWHPGEALGSASAILFFAQVRYNLP